VDCFWGGGGGGGGGWGGGGGGWVGGLGAMGLGQGWSPLARDLRGGRSLMRAQVQMYLLKPFGENLTGLGLQKVCSRKRGGEASAKLATRQKTRYGEAAWGARQPPTPNRSPTDSSKRGGRSILIRKRRKRGSGRGLAGVGGLKGQENVYTLPKPSRRTCYKAIQKEPD